MKTILIITLLLSIQLTTQQTNTNSVSTSYDISQLTYENSIFENYPKFIPNIDYLGQGYNIFNANPHSTQGIDPGYSGFNVLNFEYNSNVLAALKGDKKWIVPNGVRSNSYISCTSSYSSKQIESMSKYRESLSVGVSVGASFPLGSFSVSADYKQTEEGIKSNSSLFIESTANCVVFDLALYTSKNFRPKLSKQIIEVLLQLESKGTDYESYYNFFDFYGTHVVDKVKLGSKFGYKFELKIEEATKMKSQGMSLEAAASSSVVSASLGISSESSRQEAFKNTVKTWKSFSVGALPDPDNDVAKWASQSIDNPMPVQARVITYDKALELFAEENPQELTAAKIANLKSRFQIALAQYCSGRLLLAKKVTACADSDAKLKANFQETFLTNFDSLIRNGRQPLVIMNIKSSRFIYPQPETINIKYYTGIQDFQWSFIRADPVKNYYYIKSVTANKCMVVHQCSFGQAAGIVMNTCAQTLCQQWEVKQVEQKFYKIKSQNSSRFLAADGRGEGQDTRIIQYDDHDCNGCNVFMFFLPGSV